MFYISIFEFVFIHSELYIYSYQLLVFILLCIVLFIHVFFVLEIISIHSLFMYSF